MKFVFHNIGYKLSALILAVVVWAIIQGEQILEVNREVTVNLVVPEGYAIRGDSTRIASLTLKGPRIMVMETPRSLKVDIEIPALKAKRFRVRINPENIKGINPRLNVAIHEPYFNIYVDEIATRTVPIRYIPHGTTAEGYFVKKVTLNPSHVKITGLKSDLLKIREVTTVPIDISDLKEALTAEKALIPPQEILASQMSHATTMVAVQIGDSFINKRFSNILIEAVGSKFASRISPRYASIVLQGTPSSLKFVNSSELKAFIDATDLDPGRYEREIQFKIPPDTSLVENYPPEATLFIIAEELKKANKKK